MTAVAKNLRIDMQKVFRESSIRTFEENTDIGAIGYTPEYLRVEAEGAKQNSIANVKLVEYSKGIFKGVINTEA